LLRKSWVLIVVFILFSVKPIRGQFVFSILDFEEAGIPVELLKNDNFSSIQLRNLQVKKIENVLRLHGFVEAYLKDETQNDLDSVRVLSMVLGPRYFWKNLRFSFSDSSLKIDPKRLSLKEGTIVNQDNIEENYLNVVRHLANLGYPFALGQFQEVEIRGNEISAVAYFKLGPKVIIDTIINVGDPYFSNYLLQNATGVFSGDLFNEKKISKALRRVNSYDFIKMDDPPKIFFFEEGARIYLNPRKSKSNSFNALLGLLPGSNSEKLAIVGDALLNLTNAFGVGEKITLEFQKNALRNTELESQIEIPFFFNPKTSFETSFSLIKQDTLFFKGQFSTSLYLSLLDYSKIGFNYEVVSSRVLVEEGRGNGSYNANLYSAKFLFNNQDNNFNPSSGSLIKMGFGLGIKDLASNPNGLDVNRIPQKRGSLTMGNNLKFSKRITVSLEANAGVLISDTILRNEYFRIGGNKLLKGFDEKSIFANKYFVETIKLKYFYQQLSSINLFFNGAILEDLYLAKSVDYPFGFGAELQLPIPSGVFKISYAVGRRFNNPIIFENGNIHFSLINQF
jgi:hypothetical protein